jgi:hypothetical protein
MEKKFRCAICNELKPQKILRWGTYRRTKVGMCPSCLRRRNKLNK